MGTDTITDFVRGLAYYLIVIGAISVNKVGILGTSVALFVILIPIVFGGTFLTGRLLNHSRASWRFIMLVALPASFVLTLVIAMLLVQIKTVS